MSPLGTAAPVHDRVGRIRDLLLVDEVAGGGLVVACDSVGGIGPKPADSYAADGATVAHMATRVPLLEVLCAGARPFLVVNNLCVEAEPLGREMIEAVRAIAATAGVPPENVTGSTEDNVETRSTGIGVTVVGRLRGTSRPGGSRPGDVVLCLGLPRSAPHDRVYVGHPDLVDVGELGAALATGLVHDALPVGSKGLAWEAPLLATTAGLRLAWADDLAVPLTASGGPSSCVLVSCAPEDVAAVRNCFATTLPVHGIGRLVAADPAGDGS